MTPVNQLLINLNKNCYAQTKEKECHIEKKGNVLSKKANPATFLVPTETRLSAYWCTGNFRFNRKIKGGKEQMLV